MLLPRKSWGGDRGKITMDSTEPPDCGFRRKTESPFPKLQKDLKKSYNSRGSVTKKRRGFTKKKPSHLQQEGKRPWGKKLSPGEPGRT